MQLTIEEYSKHFKMSKEMVKSKLRTKKLNHITKNGIIYIEVADLTDTQKQKGEIVQTQNPLLPKKQPTKPKTTVATVLALYQRENAHLKEKITQLEAKIDKLINDKEQMLREERDKIESLYNTKDEQLKNILELINTKLMIEQKQQTIHDVETFIPNISEEKITKKEQNHIVELREYLKSMGLKPHQRKVIRKRFLAVYDSDIRVIKQNGKLYLDFSKYDYSDLLEY